MGIIFWTGVMLSASIWIKRDFLANLIIAVALLAILGNVGLAYAGSDYVCDYSGAGNVAKCWLK